MAVEWEVASWRRRTSLVRDANGMECPGLAKFHSKFFEAFLCPVTSVRCGGPPSTMQDLRQLGHHIFGRRPVSHILVLCRVGLVIVEFHTRASSFRVDPFRITPPVGAHRSSHELLFAG